MDELREKIAQMIKLFDDDYERPIDVADRILAIPEIAEALANTNAAKLARAYSTAPEGAGASSVNLGHSIKVRPD